jgi:hypothetical protein
VNKATRIFVLTMVLYAALLTSLHGIFEIVQGPVPTNGIAIQAIGAPCEQDQIWHACFPALTIFRTYDTAGIMTLILTGLLITRGIRPMKNRSQSLSILLLGGLLLVSGGGFIAAFIILVASTAAFFTPRDGNEEISPFHRSMAKGWPWLLFLYFGLVALESLLGAFANESVLQIGVLFLSVEFVMLILAAFAAHAWDRCQGQRASS